MSNIRFYVNGKDLKDCPVVQNEKGVNYRYPNGRYWKPKLKYFDTGKGKPKTAKRYTDGSHVPYGKKSPLDFSVTGNITSNKSVKINGLSYLNNTYKKRNKPYGFTIIYGNSHIEMIHAKTSYKAGQRVPAGKVIGKIMTPKENLESGRYSVVKGRKVGFPSHLHGATNNDGRFSKKTLRQMILAKDDISLPKEDMSETLRKKLDKAVADLSYANAELRSTKENVVQYKMENDGLHKQLAVKEKERKELESKYVQEFESRRHLDAMYNKKAAECTALQRRINEIEGKDLTVNQLIGILIKRILKFRSK